MARIIKVVIVFAAIAATGAALARPAPRLSSPLPLTEQQGRHVIDVYNAAGQVALGNIRAIEDGVFYVGSEIPTAIDVADAAFDFLQKNNVRLVVTLHPDKTRYWAEKGHLEYFRKRTGHAIETLRRPVLPEETYGLSDRSALRAAAELVSIFKRDWPMTGAIYLHGDDADGRRDAREVVVAAYELWRNRGWMGSDALWTHVERRFMRQMQGAPDLTVVRSRREAFRLLRERMEYLGEL